jgi:HD-GYP domain-containing protein (c-di-GMP phosphodiesterase class II)
VDAIAELQRGAGEHFDPRVVEAFLRAFGDISALPISA